MAATNQVQKTSIVLSGPGDWDEWLGVIRTKANAAEVWSYVDPSANDEDGQESSSALTKPHLPTSADLKGERPPLTITVTPPSTQASSSSSVTIPAVAATADTNATNATMLDQSPLTKTEEEDLKTRRYLYKQDMSTYDRRSAAVRSLLTTIQESISRTYLTYTLECDTPREMLQALKKRVAPTDQARLIELSTKYQKLLKIGRNQSLEVWLQHWEKTFTDGTKLGLPELAQHRPLFDFIKAVSDLEPDFSTYWKGEINKRLHNRKLHKLPTLFDLIEVFRNQRRESLAEKGKSSHSAFPTTFQGQPVEKESKNKKDEKKAEDTKDKASKKTCVCGEKHRWSECPYLVENKRPQGWKQDEEILKKITEKLEKNSWLKKAIEKVKDKGKKPSDKARSATEESTIRSNEEPGVFTTSLVQGYTTAKNFSSNAAVHVVTNQNYGYSLRNSFLLDSGASIHVCNDRSRFRNLRAAELEEYLIAGSSVIQIEAFGLVEITLEGPNGPKTIVLEETALVSSFHTSVVSLNRFISKNVHWNTELKALTYQGRPFCYVQQKHQQWVLEYNPLTTEQSAFATHSTNARLDKKGSAELWH